MGNPISKMSVVRKGERERIPNKPKAFHFYLSSEQRLRKIEFHVLLPTDCQREVTSYCHKKHVRNNIHKNSIVSDRRNKDGHIAKKAQKLGN